MGNKRHIAPTKDKIVYVQWKLPNEDGADSGDREAAEILLHNNKDDILLFMWEYGTGSDTGLRGCANASSSIQSQSHGFTNSQWLFVTQPYTFTEKSQICSGKIT